MLDGLDAGLGEVAGEHVDLGRAHVRAPAGTHELHALARGVGALVELAGQVLHGKDVRAGGGGVHEAVRVEVEARHGQLAGGGVYLRLAEDDGHAALEELVARALDVVAVDEAQALEALHAQDGAQLCEQLLRLHVEARLLLHVDA